MDAWFCGSAQPRVIILSVIFAFRPSVQGSETNQTERLAAGALDAHFTLMFAIPEI